MAEVKKEKYAEDESVVVDYPSNSHKSKINEKGVEEDKKGSKIISGKVIEKKSISKEVSNSFVNAWDYVVKDILVPAVKNTLSDIVQNTLDIVLFGDSSSGRKRRRGDDRTYISYSSISDDRDRPRVYSYNNKVLDDIILETRADCEEVIDYLMDIIDKYGYASVADLYESIGKPQKYTDNDYGWRDLSRAGQRKVREGYLLELPNPISIK